MKRLVPLICCAALLLGGCKTLRTAAEIVVVGAVIVAAATETAHVEWCVRCDQDRCCCDRHPLAPYYDPHCDVHGP